MAVAGKVAITLSTENGGAWSASVTYDRLVAVTHNNNLYISRKTVANVEPPNDEFWFLALEGFSGDDVEDIINGTTQVGNAKTLDGHGAEYFVQNVVVSHINNTDDPNTTEKGRIRTRHANCPTADTEYIIDTTFTDDTANIFERRQTAYGTIGNNAVYIRAKRYDSSWSEWKEVATMVDLANYIAKADKPTGTYTGNGSATERTINVGGLGNIVAITSMYGTVFVTPAGGIMSDAETVTPFSSELCFVNNGNVIMNGDDVRLNANGVTYTYNLL